MPDGVTGEEALRRFVRSLEARDTSAHTRRSYEATLEAYLGWLASRGVDWRTPGRADLRGYLAELGEGRARSSVAQRGGARGARFVAAFRRSPAPSRTVRLDRVPAPLG